jgi:RimJ/RimL family protein N-acetyltransferase
MTVLETERLRLAHLSESDSGFVLELLNEPAFLRDIGDKGVRTLADACRYLAEGPVASYTRHGFGLYRVDVKESGESVGICGFVKRDVLEQPDLGYALLARHWSHGYAIEAASATLEYGRTQLQLEQVLAITTPNNGRSIRVLEKLGFRMESIEPLAGFDTPSKIFVWTSPVQVSGET